MRKIKFRGKLISDNFRFIYRNGWIYGDYLKNDNSHFIIAKFSEGFDNGGYPSIDITFLQKVIPETVGQFTGLYDKNGKEIYEGDLFKRNTHYGVVQYLNNKFVIVFDDNRVIDLYEDECLAWNCKGHEIIGNIHDNPTRKGE